MSSRIDVSIEHRNVPEPPGKKHPNTCPDCQSHYRDDELEAALWVCPQCGHHFPMRARSRIASLADAGSFVEEAADLRSEDPLHFFDLRPYTERLAEAEMKTGLGEAMISVMTHPTTAGVLASFASLGDVIVAEPGALLAFTGPRVVQQTTREKLPEDFGLAEQNLRFGHIDAIVPRPELKPHLSRLLRLFARNGD
jgi:acetyl-CoA carboxylase beta subunit